MFFLSKCDRGYKTAQQIGSIGKTLMFFNGSKFFGKYKFKCLNEWSGVVKFTKDINGADKYMEWILIFDITNLWSRFRDGRNFLKYPKSCKQKLRYIDFR